jgi:phytoene desaturase
MRIALIGAGLSGLAAAARLAVAGHRVIVFERAASYGGAVGRWEHRGHVFDTGPGLLHLPAVYRDLFVKTGKRPLEECVELVQVDPAARHVLADGREVLLPGTGLGGVTAALDAVFGAGAGARWTAALTRARTAWEASRRPLLEDTLPADPGALARDLHPAPPIREGLLRRARRPSLAELAARELDGPVPGLARLLTHPAWEYGLDPRRAPAGAAVLAYVERTFGTWYVRGGLSALADAVRERCEERGVELRFGTGVAEIVVRDGRAAGVALADGSFEAADAVLTCAAPGTPGSVPGSTADARPSQRWASRVTVCAALRGPRPPGTPHRTVLHAADQAAEAEAAFGTLASFAGPGPDGRGIPAEDPTVTVLRPDDPALVPDAGHESVVLTAVVAAQGPVDWRAPGVADAFAERLLRRAGLHDRVVFRAVRTPADLADTTASPGGALPGPALAGAAGAWLRPPNRTPLPNVLALGHHAHPGGGLPHIGMSAAITADLASGGPGGSR